VNVEPLRGHNGGERTTAALEDRLPAPQDGSSALPDLDLAHLPEGTGYFDASSAGEGESSGGRQEADLLTSAPMASKRDGSGRGVDHQVSEHAPSGLAATILPRAELLATVFATGLAVMVVEILGTRIIGPVFGVSLFIWSALLAVTLASLAIGYYMGGRFVDRSPKQRVLSVAVLAAGVLLAITPLIARPVLSFTESLGPRIGPLFAATLLFAPSLAVLGTAGPIAVRLASTDVRAAGQLVGSVYAVSTAGSLLGTLVTGFILIPALDTNQILFGTATLLIAIGAIPLALRGRPAALASLLMPPLVLAMPAPELPSGIKILDRARSPYGLVEVIEDANRGVRVMRADHSIIGGQASVDGSAVFSFLHLLEVVRFVRPNAKDFLQIGLGIGSVPMALRPFGVKSDVVEIDPAVVDFAKRHFGFATAGDIFVEDARTFLNRTERQYDIVLHDTFTGGATPEHLFSIEVLRRIRTVLRPGGLLALNFLGYDTGPNAEASWAVARTVRAVFPTVRIFRDAPQENPPSIANLVFFASDSPLDFRIPDTATFENDVCRNVLGSFREWETLQDVPNGPIIEDWRNPLARLQLAISESHFRAMQELLPKEVWLRF
jgi:spermidine synthase